MSDEATNAALDARRQKMESGRRKSGPIPLILFFLAMSVIAAFILAPDQIRSLLGLETSDSEEIQKASKTSSSGISTQFDVDRKVDTKQKTQSSIVVPKKIAAKANDSSQDELNRLQKEIDDLKNRPIPEGGMSQQDMQALLNQQAALLEKRALERDRMLRQAFDARMAALEARPVTPNADELAAEEKRRLLEEARQKRLEELARRKAEREAELKERRISDANVYDETEEGQTSGGQDGKNANEGVKDNYSKNESFLDRNKAVAVDTSIATDLPDVSKVIVQGTIITAVMETALDTELPGNIRASVTRPVYSYDGTEVLMPAGTRLIGTYNSDISIAQKRVLIAWTRAVTPEGKSVTMSATGTDRLGRGGLAGNVDTRFGKRFGTALLITSIAAVPSFITAALGDTNADSNGSTSSAAADLAVESSEALSDQTEKVVEEYLSLPPIIRVPQGSIVKVMVNQDLLFQ